MITTLYGLYAYLYWVFTAINILPLHLRNDALIGVWFIEVILELLFCAFVYNSIERNER